MPRSNLIAMGAPVYRYPKSNFTDIPNEVFDYWMGMLNGSEYKVLFYLCGRIFRFDPDCETLSLPELMAGTGLTKTTTLKAIKTLDKYQLVWIGQSKHPETSSLANQYSILPDGIVNTGWGE